MRSPDRVGRNYKKFRREREGVELARREVLSNEYLHEDCSVDDSKLKSSKWKERYEEAFSRTKKTVMLPVKEKQEEESKVGKVIKMFEGLTMEVKELKDQEERWYDE